MVFSYVQKIGLLGICCLAITGCSNLHPFDQTMPDGICYNCPEATASIEHITVELPEIPPPRTPQNPNGVGDWESAETWKLELAEALSTALDHAEVLRTSLVLPGFGSGTAVQQTVYDPAINETLIEEALAAFDTSLETSIFWEQQDQPVSQSAGFQRPGKIDLAVFRSRLLKPLATGGQASLAFNTNYLFINPVRFNQQVFRSPAQYSPNVEFALSQPLLRGAGTDVNRAPIVIARINSDQSAWQFKQAMLNLVRSVESAYWELHAALIAVQAIDQVLPQAARAAKIQEDKLRLGAGFEAELGQAQAQLATFRQRRLELVDVVLEREALLRELLGIRPNDVRRIVPVDEPRRAPIAVDWKSTLSIALNQRPDIVRRRLAVRVRELELLIARNQLLPSLDVQGLWRISGLDNELDDAIDLLTDNRFTDWSLGVSFQVPLGNRAAAAAVQRGELQLQRESALLEENARSMAHQLSGIVRDLSTVYGQYELAQERMRASEVWARGSKIRYEDPPGGLSKAQALDIYLRSLDSWSTAATEAARFLAQFNSKLAELEEAKGTLLAYDNISLQEDPCAALRFRNSYMIRGSGLLNSINYHPGNQTVVEPQSEWVSQGGTGPASDTSPATGQNPNATAEVEPLILEQVNETDVERFPPLQPPQR